MHTPWARSELIAPARGFVLVDGRRGRASSEWASSVSCRHAALPAAQNTPSAPRGTTSGSLTRHGPDDRGDDDGRRRSEVDQGDVAAQGNGGPGRNRGVPGGHRSFRHDDEH